MSADIKAQSERTNRVPEGEPSHTGTGKTGFNKQERKAEKPQI